MGEGEGLEGACTKTVFKTRVTHVLQSLSKQVPGLNSEFSITNRKQAEEECDPNISSVLNAFERSLTVLG